MLKLLKYELIHSWRSFSLVYLVFLGVCTFSPLLWRGDFQKISSDSMLSTLTIFIIIIMTFAITISTMVNIALNYRNSMFKKPGYLTLTLPVSTHELILSKVIADILWIFIAFFVLILGYFLMGFMMIILDGSMSLPTWNDWVYLFQHIVFDFKDLGTMLMFFVQLIITLAEGILFIYFCITAVQTKFTTKHKTAAAIALFFAVSIILSLLTDNLASMFASMHLVVNGFGSQLIDIFYNVILGGLFYAGTYYVLEKKLEVE